MATLSRAIFAAVLGTGLGFVAGCGSKPAPTLPQVSLDGGSTSDSLPPPNPPAPASPTPDPGGKPKIEPPKVAAWEIDQTKHAIPAAPVKGRIVGVDVTPEVRIEGTELTFTVPKSGTLGYERRVRINLAPMLVAGQPIPAVLGRDWKVKLDDAAGPGVPVVWREVDGKAPLGDANRYALTLELGPRRGGKVAGRVYLSLSDEEKTFLAGTFEAPYIRPHLERPGPEDAPSISGQVTVTGAKPDAEVRITYAAFTSAGDFLIKELQMPFDPVPAELAAWTRENLPEDAPRVSTLVAGDGKSRPALYDHTNLPPGRYLLSAGVVGGPSAWKWVDLPAGGALTENFILDATKTGGMEVIVPVGVMGKLLVAPADAPEKSALDMERFHGIALQVVRQDGNIVGGKALIKNLGPGKYEVRAGDLRGMVEVVAGKTVELTLTAPKKP